MMTQDSDINESVAEPTIFSANEIADYFIRKGIEADNPLDQMKVQKLVYIAHGWHLGITGIPLVASDIQAWKFGPVIEDLYHRLKFFGNDKINKPITHSSRRLDSHELVKQFLDHIWNTYGKFDAVNLSDLTHQPDTPWDQVANDHNYKLGKGLVIPNHSIQSYYKQLVNE